MASGFNSGIFNRHYFAGEHLGKLDGRREIVLVKCGCEHDQFSRRLSVYKSVGLSGCGDHFYRVVHVTIGEFIAAGYRAGQLLRKGVLRRDFL